MTERADGTAQLADDVIVSHESAAVLHGLPLWRLDLERVRVTCDRASGGRRSARVHLRTAPVDPVDIRTISGLRVTSLERTIVDLARSVPFEQAVVAADAALARGADRERAGMIVDGMRRWAGVPAARRVLDAADRRSESVGETRSRLAIAAAGLPVPELQWAVWSPTGVRYQTDFSWPDHGTVGEFDGKVKYGRLLRTSEDPGDAVFREKLREDTIRDTGLHMVRWTWRDLADFGPTAARLGRRLGSTHRH